MNQIRLDPTRDYIQIKNLFNYFCSVFPIYFCSFDPLTASLGRWDRFAKYGRFCKNICDLISTSNKLNLKVKLANKMIINFSMIGASVKDWIWANCKSRDIVTPHTITLKEDAKVFFLFSFFPSLLLFAIRIKIGPIIY